MKVKFIDRLNKFTAEVAENNMIYRITENQEFVISCHSGLSGILLFPCINKKADSGQAGMTKLSDTTRGCGRRSIAYE